MARVIFSIIFFLVNNFYLPLVTVTSPDQTQLLIAARKQFYQVVTEKKVLAAAIIKFQELRDQYPAHQARFLTYLGALEALKGKHAFWPHQKYNHVIKGLAMMDTAIAQNPNDLEALFIHSTTCYYLPGFFNRQTQAQDFFKRIIAILPDDYQHYNPDLLANVIEFLKQHAHLTPIENAQLEHLRQQLVQP